MHYTIKSGKSVSHHGPGRVVAVVGSEGASIAIDVVGINGLHIKLAVHPVDFDDEPSCVQLVRLAERIQLMATAASNRRFSAQLEARGASEDVP